MLTKFWQLTSVSIRIVIEKCVLVGREKREEARFRIEWVSALIDAIFG